MMGALFSVCIYKRFYLINIFIQIIYYCIVNETIDFICIFFVQIERFAKLLLVVNRLYTFYRPPEYSRSVVNRQYVDTCCITSILLKVKFNKTKNLTLRKLPVYT